MRYLSVTAFVARSWMAFSAACLDDAVSVEGFDAVGIRGGLGPAERRVVAGHLRAG